MKRNKRSVYLFTISFVITACIIGGFLATCIAYENIVKTAYGEYKRAVEIDGGRLRIFDFEYKTVGKQTTVCLPTHILSNN